MKLTRLLSLFSLLFLFTAIQGYSQCFVNFSSSSSAGNASFTLTTTGGLFNPYFYWTFGDGTSAYSATYNQSHTYANNGIYSVCVTMIDSISNCTASYCDSLQITGVAGGSCTAAFTPSISGSTVTFYNNSSGPFMYSWWDFGDGGSSTSTNPTHTYASPGTYTVCVSIWNNSNCADTICMPVTITGSSSCHAGFTPSVSGNTVSLANTSSGNYTSVFWDFGDGSTSTSTNPTHTYATSGTYTVCLSIMGSGCTDTACNAVVISGSSGGGCNASFSYSINGAYLTATNTSSGTFSNVIWNFGDGTYGYNPISVNHTYTTTGWVSLCLTIMDSATNCISTSCDTIYVQANTPNCLANFSYTVSGLNVTFTNTSTGIYNNSLWVFGDNSTSNLTNPTHTYAAPGTYNVLLGISGNSNGCADSIVIPVTVTGGSSNCVASYTYTTSGNTLAVVNTSTGSFTSVNWMFGDGGTASGSTATHTYSSAGAYIVCVVVSDSNSNCYDIYCDSVVVSGSSSSCQANFTTYPDTTGQYGLIGINLSSGSNLSYMWTFGDGGSSTAQYPIHTYASAGTYQICLTVSNGNCTSTFCDTVTVTQKMASTLTIIFLDPATAVTQPLPGPEVAVYPNPFNGSFNIALDLQNGGQVAAELYDLSGKSVAKVFEGTLNSGKSELNFAAEQTAPGVYFLRVTAEGRSSVVKVLKAQ
ncbi:MAG: PKD domain-containing protein [Bacteroidia bacterium]|nr:PKD domain-containing protein [Bacteroidia bacterium]